MSLTTDPETNESKPYLKDRQTMGHFATKKVDAGEMQAYQQECNSRSLDGLPALRSALKDGGNYTWRVKLDSWCNRHWYEIETVKSVALILLVGLMVLSWGEYPLLLCR